jgi:hypothetical protein
LNIEYAKRKMEARDLHKKKTPGFINKNIATSSKADQY